MQVIHHIEQQLQQVILGKPTQIRLALTCLLAQGHLLLEDLPGMGKTTLAHSLATTLGLAYRRVQFTNDMLPADVTGFRMYDPQQQEFRLQPGPVFTQVLLADEINRASPKTQSALLEVMEERQVTIDGETLAIPAPFFVIATQNPSFQSGTHSLPESQLDRFLMRLSLGFPTRDAELQLLQRPPQDDRSQQHHLKPLLNPDSLRQLQQQVHLVHTSDALLHYMLDLIHASRQHNDMHPLSPRASVALLKATRAYALLDGRDYATANDVQAVFSAVCEHRLQGAQHHAQAYSVRLLQQVPCTI
jgi:MoxR-like ATPase